VPDFPTIPPRLAETPPSRAHSQPFSPMTTTLYHLRLDARAMALMVLLCALWGLQQVAIKVAVESIPPLLQSGLRSAGAVALVWVWARWRRIPLFARDGSLWP